MQLPTILVKYLRKMTAEKTAAIIFLCGLIFGTNAIPIDKFYPFGRDNGDSQLETTSSVNADTVNGEITLKVPIKFYGDSYTAIYVSANKIFTIFTLCTQIYIRVGTRYMYSYMVASLPRT